MEVQEIIAHLTKILSNKNDLKEYSTCLDIALKNTFDKCFIYCFETQTGDSDYKLEIDTILDYLHDELNTGHWSEVPLNIRYAFSAVTYLKTIIHLLFPQNDILTHLEETLKIVDLGILLGAPLPKFPELLTNCAKYLGEKIANLKNESCDIVLHSRKRKLDDSFAAKFRDLAAGEIKTESCPSLETFSNLYFGPQKPVKVKDCMSHWPATTKWLNVNYLMSIAGSRTIPVEIGSHYVHNDWHQKLMLFKDFIKQYFLEDCGEIGYLAQHNLFDQVPELREDICIPEYCCISNNDNDSDPDINAWLGPQGTVSPLHQDPKNNFLAQVFGTKQLILFPPTDDKYLYPHDGTLLSNTSQVDPINPDLDKYPEFTKATMYKCLLEPGEMLFIPIKWWHHVTALDKSFSVSFWWE